MQPGPQLTASKVFFAVLAALVVFVCGCFALLTFLTTRTNPALNAEANRLNQKSKRLSAELQALEDAELIGVEILQTWRVKSEVSHQVVIHNRSPRAKTRITGYFEMTTPDGESIQTSPQNLYFGQPIRPGQSSQTIVTVETADNVAVDQFKWAAKVEEAWD